MYAAKTNKLVKKHLTMIMHLIFVVLAGATILK